MRDNCFFCGDITPCRFMLMSLVGDSPHPPAKVVGVVAAGTQPSSPGRSGNPGNPRGDPIRACNFRGIDFFRASIFLARGCAGCGGATIAHRASLPSLGQPSPALPPSLPGPPHGGGPRGGPAGRGPAPHPPAPRLPRLLLRGGGGGVLPPARPRPPPGPQAPPRRRLPRPIPARGCPVPGRPSGGWGRRRSAAAGNWGGGQS